MSYYKGSAKDRNRHTLRSVGERIKAVHTTSFEKGACDRCPMPQPATYDDSIHSIRPNEGESLQLQPHVEPKFKDRTHKVGSPVASSDSIKISRVGMVACHAAGRLTSNMNEGNCQSGAQR